MAKLRFTRPARQDLDDIWAYIGRDNPDAAGDFVDRIGATCRRISEMPYMGRDRPDILAGIRSFAVGRYLILYRFSDDSVEILRVIHSARDIGTLFK